MSMLKVTVYVPIALGFYEFNQTMYYNILNKELIHMA
jgi:hypothetical protein